jgi:hypothetical protein
MMTEDRMAEGLVALAMTKRPRLELSFMQWWKVTNEILRANRRPEIRYGEARDWWNRAIEISRSYEL